MTPDSLFKLAAKGEMIPGAPVKASATVTIAAPITRVWQLATDVARWSSWYPYLSNAEVGGTFRPGVTLTYGGLIKHRLVIASVKEFETVTVCGRMLIYDGITRWDFAATPGGGTGVTFTESSAGPLLGTLYSEASLRGHLAEWLEALKAEAERHP